MRENNFDMMHYCNLTEMSHVTEKHIRLHSVPEVCGKGSRCIIAAVTLRLWWRLRRRFILRIRVWRRCRGRLGQRLSRRLLRGLGLLLAWSFAPIEPAPTATEGSSLACRRAAACIDEMIFARRKIHQSRRDHNKYVAILIRLPLYAPEHPDSGD